MNFWPYYFHPKEVDAGREIMTAWIAKVHEAVKRRGSTRELVISIPASIKTCLSRGLDPEEWLRRGIVDVFVAQKPAQPELMDPNSTLLVYEEWLLKDIRVLVEAARGSQCRVHAAIDSHLDSDRLAEAPIEMIRAAACNFWAQGIDGLYVSGWHGNWPFEASVYEKLRELPHPDIMDFKDKFYHIPTVSGRYSKSGLTAQLPAELQVNRPVKLELTINDDLPRWDTVGRVHEVLLRFRVMSITELDRLTFRLNGKVLPDSSLRTINEMYRMSAPRYRTGSGERERGAQCGRTCGGLKNTTIVLGDQLHFRRSEKSTIKNHSLGALTVDRQANESAGIVPCAYACAAMCLDPSGYHGHGWGKSCNQSVCPIRQGDPPVLP